MKNTPYINLLIADDSCLIIDTMKKIFKNSNHINVIGDCSDGSEVLPFIKNNKTDAILMDIVMKNVCGIEAIKRVKNYDPQIKIVGFSLTNNALFIQSLINSGADGFISKYEANKEILEKELIRVVSVR